MLDERRSSQLKKSRCPLSEAGAKHTGLSTGWDWCFVCNLALCSWNVLARPDWLSLSD